MRLKFCGFFALKKALYLAYINDLITDKQFYRASRFLFGFLSLYEVDKRGEFFVERKGDDK